ncbi:MAG TPA: hypothetical protein VMU89_05055 [Thermomicrobiaceae bacterium]|nr:hypothetical protein [Thermomicrobiaceae bacterium]
MREAAASGDLNGVRHPAHARPSAKSMVRTIVQPANGRCALAEQRVEIEHADFAPGPVSGDVQRDRTATPQGHFLTVRAESDDQNILLTRRSQVIEHHHQ